MVALSGAQPPQVTLDGNVAIEGISPVPVSVIPGEKLLIGIVADHVADLHSYSVRISFDPAIVLFDGAVAKLSPLQPAFLESQKGKLAAFLSVPGNGCVEIAATQAGKDPAASGYGTGILGYVSFIARDKGDPRITATEARLVNPEGNSTYAEIP